MRASSELENPGEVRPGTHTPSRDGLPARPIRELGPVCPEDPKASRGCEPGPALGRAEGSLKGSRGGLRGGGGDGAEGAGGSSRVRAWNGDGHGSGGPSGWYTPAVRFRPKTPILALVLALLGLGTTLLVIWPRSPRFPPLDPRLPTEIRVRSDCATLRLLLSLPDSGAPILDDDLLEVLPEVSVSVSVARGTDGGLQLVAFTDDFVTDAQRMPSESSWVRAAGERFGFLTPEMLLSAHLAYYEEAPAGEADSPDVRRFRLMDKEQVLREQWN